MMLAYLCIGLAFIPEFEERSIQVALVCATDPDEIPDTNLPELAAWDMLPKGDVDAHRATVKLVATALAGPKLLTRRPWDNNTQQFAVQTMGRPDTTTTTVAFGLDDTGSRNVSAANTPHATARGDGRTDESTLPDREPTVVPTADAPSTAVPQYSRCLMDAGSAPDAILTHPRPPLFTLSDGPPQPPNLPTPADSNPAAYYLQDDDDRISWAVANWEEETCIRFTKCSSPFTCEEPFMVFVSDASRCDAPVGTSGCVSEVNIRTIRYQGWVAHVTAHALGLSRENTRNDRDGYVTLNESNIWSKSERAADRCRAIADGAAFRRGRGEEDGFVEFHSEGHLQPVVHEAPVVVRARVAPRGAKLLEVAGSFSTNFAATISDVSVATCSVVARMAAGTTDAPPSAVPQTAAPAPCTCH
ncbi:Astacin [Diplonema papillatum]|nr:Astacin [Diplonema papillatum]